jgi:ABC-type branched-subunit amino acid transport system ATPase component
VNASMSTSLGTTLNANTDAILQTIDLCKSFGALTVASHINFELKAGDRHALIGPNGAGKTTFVNLLTGRLAPSSGSQAGLGSYLSN